jgi:hypothetical protein
MIFKFLRSWSKPEYEFKDKVNDYTRVFETDHGRRVLQDLMGEFHIFTPTFIPNTGPEATFVAEGQRSVVLYILEKLQVRDLDRLAQEAEF